MNNQDKRIKHLEETIAEYEQKLKAAPDDPMTIACHKTITGICNEELAIKRANRASSIGKKRNK